MVYKCCVPNCKGNYPNTPKVAVFSFPKDPSLCQKWIRSIHRADFTPTKYSKVCQQHFKDDDIESASSYFDEKTGRQLTVPLSKPRLRPNAVPCLMPNCPDYLSNITNSRQSLEDKKLQRENRDIQTALAKSIAEKQKYDEQNKFTSFAAFLNCLDNNKLSDPWTVIKKSNEIWILWIKKEITPFVNASVIINDKLECSVFHKEIELPTLGKHKFPYILSDINNLLDILVLLEASSHADCEDTINFVKKLLLGIVVSDDKQDTINFIIEQLGLLQCEKVRYRYLPETLIFFSILHSISPHAYNFMRSSLNLIMPHPRTIKRICSNYNTNPLHEQTDETILSFIKQKFKTLRNKDLTVLLMIDEIHIKPYFDYKGGNVVGMSYNAELAANRAYTFMVQSFLSSFKEVVHILPVSKFEAEDLHKFIKKVIVGLHKIGFRVICVVSDNNKINKKAMSFFVNPPKSMYVYPHPCNSSEPLFFALDAVHIFKCIRNNWLNQKNLDQAFYFPDWDDFTKFPLTTASFKTIKQLYEVECGSALVRYAHSLTLKALNPSNLERQNVKLVLQVFNRFTVEALNTLGEKNNLMSWKGTSDFINLICNWWGIMNVKTPLKGQRLRDPLQQPFVNKGLTKPENVYFIEESENIICLEKVNAVLLEKQEGSENMLFLEKFVSWLDAWHSHKCSTGTFTPETHWAISQTSHCIVELAKYCFTELGFAYFLPGKVQTDSLEDRFGKYRMMAGSQYLISIRQVYECEAKLRMQNFCPLTLNSSTYGLIEIETVDDNKGEAHTSSVTNINFDIDVFEKDFEGIENSMPVLVYLAGYCAHSALRKLNCPNCTKLLKEDRDKKLECNSNYKLIQNLDRGGLVYPSVNVVNAVYYNYIVLQKLLSQQYEGNFLKLPDQRTFVIEKTSELINSREFFFFDDNCGAGHTSETVLKLVLTSCTNSLLKNYCNKKNDIKKLQIQKKSKKLETLTKNISGVVKTVV